MFLALATLALAQEEPLPTPPPSAYTRDWEGSYQRSHAVATIGQVSAIAGPPLFGIGVFVAAASALGPSGDEGTAVAGASVALVGGVATAAGLPMLAGGTMRMRRTLTERGLEVSPTLGWVTWGLYLAPIPLSFVAFASPEAGGAVAVLGTGTYIGAIATGSVFRGQLSRAHESAVRRSIGDWTIVPKRDGLLIATRW